MKRIILILPVFAGLFACHQPDRMQELQNRISVLEKKIDSSYKPDFGELMTGIQIHHNKLWFAGQNQNWKLAGFEVKEIKELLENIKKYQSERIETQNIEMIFPPLDSVSYAIGQQSPSLFKTSYSGLTNMCNDCHRVSDFEFNLIKIPETPAFSNQDYKPEAN